MASSNRLILVDGSGFIFRAYHSLPPLTRPDGTPVGAVYGFTNMLLKVVNDLPASHIAVIFDAARKTFRNDLYAEYKANRPPAPEDLVPQFPLVREATRALNLPSIELANFEADDIIATYTRQAREKGMDVVIVSSDKDLMQLIQDGVTMYDGMKSKTIGPGEVQEKFGVAPDKVVEVLALMGDSSDNVPGIPGIGPKTAAELIHQYGTVENLLAHVDEIKQPKRREAIQQNAELARISKELVILKDDCENIDHLDDLAAKPLDPEKLLPFLKEQGFNSLLTRMQGKLEKSAPHPSPLPVNGERGLDRDTGAAGTPSPPQGERVGVRGEYVLVQDESALQAWIEKATRTGKVAFDVETNTLQARKGGLVGFSLCVTPGEACYVPLAHKLRTHPPSLQGGGKGEGVAPQTHEWESGSLFSPHPLPNPPPEGGGEKLKSQIPFDRAIALLKPLLENPAVLKIGHNIKFDMLVMKQYGIEVAPIEDTMLLSYCLAAGAHLHNMDDLAEKYLGLTPVSYKEVTGTGKSQVTFDYVELEKARDYAAEDADITLRFENTFKPRVISEHLVSVYERLERPLVPVIVRMENYGVKVDAKKLNEISRYLEQESVKLEEQIHKLAGHPFNIASPKQLGEVLFEEMGIGGGKKSKKTGAYSTGVEVLDELAAQGHEIALKVLDWRQLTKLKSTYTDTLVEQINPNTGRVHTSYSLAVASTGRLASSDPNLQNIPIRSEQGRKIREAFVAEEGYQLLSADYSQIELRLLAHVANIEPLKQAFREGKDIHAITASQIFNTPVEQVDAELRRQAKTINFGIIYGMSAHGLSTRLGIPRAQAAEYIARYFQQYPGIPDYMEGMKEAAREKGYVETLSGRRCHIPGIRDKNPNMRAFSERAAINAPLQGSAADIIKKAMIQVDRLLYGSLSSRALDEPVSAGDGSESYGPGSQASGTRSPTARFSNESKALGKSGFGDDSNHYKSRMLLQVHDELVFEIADGEADALVPLIKKTMEQATYLSVPLVVEVGLGKHWGEVH